MSIKVLIYLFIIATGCIIGLVRFKYLTKPFKILCILLGLTLLSELSGLYIYSLKHNNCPPYHFFTIIEYASFACIFSLLLYNKTLKKLIRYSIIVFSIISICSTIFLQNIWQFPSIIFGISYSTLTILCLCLFTQMLNKPNETPLFKDAVFWFNIASFIQFSCSFFSLTLTNYLYQQKNISQMINNIMYVINLFFYITLAIAILFATYKKQETSAKY